MKLNKCPIAVESQRRQILGQTLSPITLGNLPSKIGA